MDNLVELQFNKKDRTQNKIENKQKYEIIFADFETLTFDSLDYKRLKHTDVFLWYLKDENNTFDKLGETIKEFIYYLFSLNKNLIIYFHNLSFDGDFIFKYFLSQKDFKFINVLDKFNRDINCFRILNNGNKIYEIEVNKVIKNEGRKKRIRLKFKCTYNLLSSSINALGKTLNLEKLDEIDKLIKKGIIKDKNEFYNKGGFKMNNEIKEAFIKYIKQDVEIARLSYINFKNNVYNLPKNIIFSNRFNKNCLKVENCNTIGGLVYKLSKNYIFNTFGANILKKYKIKESDYDLAKLFFCGGYTQFNPDYWNKYFTNIIGYVIDINSSYPFQMTKLLPIGPLQKSINKKWKYVMTWYEIDISWMRIKDEYKNFVCLKNFSKDTNLRYERELYDTKVYYRDEEWEFIKKIYNVKVNKITTYFCEAIYLFKDLIEILYKFKEHYGNLGQEANKLTYKIMMNSLFGRQCMRKAYDVEIWVDDDYFMFLKDLREQGLGVIFNNKRYAISHFRNRKQAISNLNGVLLQRINENDRRNYTNILIGAAITSYARLQLWETILKFGVNEFIYSDTDSIFLNTKKKIEDYVEIDKNKLGAWSIDATFKEGKIFGAKRYIVVKSDGKGIKFGFSGVNNLKFDDINIDEIFQENNVLKEAQTIIERDDYGIILKRRDLIIKKGNL